jgi:hypothetical protein
LEEVAIDMVERLRVAAADQVVHSALRHYVIDRCERLLS